MKNGAAATGQGKGGRHALTFVLAAVLIDMIGFGIISPVMPDLVAELTGEGMSEAAAWNGWLLFSFAVMQFFFAPIIGALSDRFGRRPVLIFSILAFGIDYLLMAFAPTLEWLFVGRLIAGVAGSAATVASAYVADVSPPEKRAQNFGLIGAMFGVGFTLGPVIGGLLGEFGPRVPFFAAAGLALANFVYGYFVLPESLPKENRRAFSWSRANTFGAFFQMRHYPMAVGLFAALFIYQLAHDALPTSWNFYTIVKFGWSESERGLSMGLIGIMTIIVMAGLTRALLPRLGEERTAYLGIVCGAVGFLGFAFAETGWVMLAWIVPWSLFGLIMPSLRGILSNQVPDNAQGELQGALTSLKSLTALIAPLFMSQLFYRFTQEDAPVYFPGAPFFAAGALLLFSGVIVMLSIRMLPVKRRAASHAAMEEGAGVTAAQEASPPPGRNR